jgi:secondary thiamine-phosphate synthase enzyme
MKWHKDMITVKTGGKGLYPITEEITRVIKKWKLQEGMCYLFINHTSASLAVNESYDPTARLDLEEFVERLAPEAQSWHKHTLEGADDSPSHMRAILTLTSLSIPVDDGELSLGTWQGIYLFEHRSRGHSRKILIRGLDVS